MKMNIGEFAKLLGVSVRTLHHYDKIGLLKPDFTDQQTGYRYYDVTAMETAHQILFYRELDFSLREIKKIISSSDYNKQEALNSQKHLLVLKRQRLDKIIKMLDGAMKGEKIMEFNAFDKSEINSYKAEVKKRWGTTVAYREHKQKTADYTQDKWYEVSSGINNIISQFASLKSAGERPDSCNAAKLVKRLQSFITATQYTCTNEILSSLGEIYVADARFKNNIDKAGEGTAEFISQAITSYCKQ